MDEITNTETTNVCEPETEPVADGEAHEPKPASSQDAEPAEPSASLEQMVRDAIDRRIAELFPPRREIPRVEAASGELLPEQRLRLGYRTREPNT
jgi:hypothetical protein